MSNSTLLKISSASTEYVRVGVTYVENAVAVDPTGYVVKMAFVAPDTTPGLSDWKTASWQTIGSKFFALCLIGPDGVPIPVGFYNVWVRIEGNPEKLVKNAGSLTIE